MTRFRLLQILPSLVTATILSILLATPSRAEWTVLPARKVNALYAGLCSGPTKLETEQGREFSVCPVKGESEVDENGDPVGGHYPGNGCSLSLDRYRHDGAIRVWFGRFTGNQRQAFVAYWGCEGHFNNFGGAALLDEKGSGFVLNRFYPGWGMDDCTVMPGGQLPDRLYCYSGSMHQGELIQNFGRLAFDEDGELSMDNMAGAENIDGAIGVSLDCDRTHDIHHFFRVSREGSSIRLLGAYVNPGSAGAACDRLQREDFDEDDKKFHRDEDPHDVWKRHTLLRKDEDKYNVVELRFSSKKSEETRQYTTLDAEQDDQRFR